MQERMMRSVIQGVKARAFDLLNKVDHEMEMVAAKHAEMESKLDAVKMALSLGSEADPAQIIDVIQQRAKELDDAKRENLLLREKFRAFESPRVSQDGGPLADDPEALAPAVRADFIPDDGVVHHPA